MPDPGFVFQRDDTDDDSSNKLHDHFDGFDDKVIDALGDEDLADIQTVNAILNIGRCKRRVKFYHKRINWERYVREIQETNVQASGNTGFDECFRIRMHIFDHLHDAIKEYISVDFKRSMVSTQENDPIYPELVMACGLRFLGLDSNISDLKDTYGMLKSSVKQVINMFFAAVDNNTDCSELKIKLPDPANVFELNKLVSKFV